MKKGTEVYTQREYQVVKSNDLIQKSRYNMTLEEQKTIAYICSMIKPIKAAAGQEVLYQLDYQFSIADYCKVCGIQNIGGTRYEHVKSTIKSLRDKSMWLLMPDGGETVVSWLDRVTIYKKSGKIKIKLDDRLVPYLFDLSRQFTQYQLISVLAMKSSYSIRLYELLKSYAYQKEKTFDIDSLKKILAAENYDRFPDFRRRVLEPAEKEINLLTDISINILPINKGRKVIAVKFEITAKSENEKIMAMNYATDELDIKSN